MALCGHRELKNVSGKDLLIPKGFRASEEYTI